MNLTLHLSPETSAKLKEQASLTGKSPEELAVAALQEMLAIGAESMAASSTAQLAALRAWLESMPGGSPEADLSRESIYGNRGE